MKRIFLILTLATISASSMAQLGTVSNNKPLGYINPALQNYEMDKGVVSASYVINPFLKDTTPAGLLGIAEFKINDKFRIGLNAFQVENRLSRSQAVRAYMSYKLELEKGSYLIVGANVGAYTDEVKVKEFNKVFAPNVFSFAPDSSATGLEKGVDAGLGVAYSYNNLMVGIGFGKVNKPAAYPFPISVIKRDPADSTQFLLKDTSIMLESSNYGIELNFNVVYQWDPSDKVKMIHSFHVGNFDLAGADYVGLQNIAEINNRHSIGLGGFYNGTPGFIGTLGFGVTENLKIESTTFLAQDLNFDRSVGRFGDYISDGYKPSFEFNLRFEF